MTKTKKYSWLNSKGGKMEITLEITREVRTEKAFADGWNVELGEELFEMVRAVVTLNGNYVASGKIQEVLKSEIKLIKMGAVAKLGKVLFIKEVYENITVLIAEAFKEIEKTEEVKNFRLEEEKEEEIKANAEIAEAKEIIQKAHKQAAFIENLPTKERYERWIRRYNNVHNEGADGYVPPKVTIEDYETAVNVLSKHKAN